MYGSKFPIAKDCLEKDRYVEDIPIGDETEEGWEEQMWQVAVVLDKVTFSLKHINRSGDKPGDKASTIEFTKMLEYKWFTEKDMFAPGLSELKMNKKIRGRKKPNKSPIVTYTDASRLVQGSELTQSDVVAKVAEFFYPTRMWEQCKTKIEIEINQSE